MCWDHIDDEGNSIRGVLVNKNGPGEFSVTSTGATICDKTRNRHEAAAKIQEGQEDHVYNKLQENMNKKLHNIQIEIESRDSHMFLGLYLL